MAHNNQGAPAVNRVFVTVSRDLNLLAKLEALRKP